VKMPLVAIVGAPNLGKSTLFNRLVGWRKAIVTDEPGVTRDRNYGEVRDEQYPFRLVDTGGLTPRTAAPFAGEIMEQAEAAIDEAACVVFLVDARAGATAVDHEVAAWLRRKGKPIILVANKADTPTKDDLAHDLYDLHLGEAIPVSAAHGRGMDLLLEAVAERIADEFAGAVDSLTAEENGDEGEEPEHAIRLAIVGRPHVGKSSVLNRLLGEDRVMVSDVAGTTRDSIDTELTHGDRTYRVIDTAGIRRKGRVRLSAEASSVVLARKSMERADVAILVLDGSEPFTAQDAHIAGYARDAMTPTAVLVNKWDLLDEREQAAKDWTEEIRYKLKFAKEVPVLFGSALTGQRIIKLLDLATSLYAQAGIRIPTAELNRWIQEVAKMERAAPARGRSIRLFYGTQTGSHPPSIVLFCNDPRHVHFSLERFLRNNLRERFGFGAAPIRLRFKGRRE
jgi:GTP-binding protein